MTPREVAAFNLGVETVAAIAESVAEVFWQRVGMPTLRRELIVCVCEALVAAATDCLLPPNDDGAPSPVGGEPLPPAPADYAGVAEGMAA